MTKFIEAFVHDLHLTIIGATYGGKGGIISGAYAYYQ